MTNQELQELSKRVAEKFGIDICMFTSSKILATVMRLAIEHEIDITFYKESGCSSSGDCLPKFESYKNHSTREQAVIVAAMKALLEVEL